MTDPATQDAFEERPLAPTDDTGHRRSVAKNAATLLGSQTFTWVLATIMLSLLPRFLGPVAAGQLRIAGSLWAMVSVLAAFGTATFITVEVAKRREIAVALVRSTNRLRIAVFIALCPFVALFIWLAGYDRTTVIIAALFGGSACIGLLAATYAAALLGLQEMGQTARVEIVTKFLATSVTAVVLVLGGRAYALVILWTFLAAFGLAMSVKAVKRVVPAGQTATTFVGRALVRASLPFLLAEGSLVIYQQIDTVVMSLLVGKEAIGWYSAADVLFGSLLFVPVILMTSMFPAIAEKFQHDPDEVGRMLHRTFHSLLLIAVPIGIGTIVVSKSFVRLIYGAKFAPSAQVLQIYGVVTILSCMTILLGRFALATGHVRYWTMLMVAAIAVSIPLDLVLVPWTDRRYHNGAMGGALAYVVTESLMLTAGIIKLAPRLIDRVSLARIARCVLAGGAMFVAGWPLRD
jgi:O-antigen/teichoic acid export membrane protein